MTDRSSPQGNFNYPVSIRLGAGKRRELPGLCMGVGMRRPLIVTDAGVRSLPWFEPLRKLLADEGLVVDVFNDVKSNPIEADVVRGVAAYRVHEADGVILLGGGSAIDVGKCVALMVEHGGSVFDYEDVGDNWLRVDGEKIPPMIALPTTAGTGSEVGRASVIADAQGQKKIIFHPKMQPPIVVADPELTLDLPPLLTAATGLDAFVHCFEAWCAKGYHPMADGIALEGMRLVRENLPRAYSHPTDVEARTHMLLASTMGATAFQKGLGVVHAISHALGGKLDVHHGLANAILLPYCMVFNRPVIEDRCERLAHYLRLEQPGFESLLSWILEFREQLSVPHTLSGVEGMDEQAAANLAPLAKSDAALSGNPRDASVSDLEKIMRAALVGDLTLAIG
jgi:alcohol dehydrogenase class IV